MNAVATISLVLIAAVMFAGCASSTRETAAEDKDKVIDVSKPVTA